MDNIGWTTLSVIPTLVDPKGNLERGLTPAAGAAGASAGKAAGSRFSGSFKGELKGAALALGGLLLSAQFAGKAVDWVQESIAKASKARGGSVFDDLAKSGDKLQLAFGSSLIDGFEQSNAGAQNLLQTVDQLTPAMKYFGETIGSELGDLANLAGGVVSVTTALGDLAAAIPGGSVVSQVASTAGNPFGFFLDKASHAVDTSRELWHKAFGDPARAAAVETAQFSRNMDFAGDALYKAGHQAAWVPDTTRDFVAMSTAVTDAAAATDRLREAQDRLAGKRNLSDARSSLEASLDAFRGLDTTKTIPGTAGKTWTDKHGKTHTSPGTPSTSVDVAFMAALNASGTDFNRKTASGQAGWSTASAAIEAINEFVAQKFHADGAPAGLAALRYGRRELRDQLTDIGFDRGGAKAFTRQYLPTPSDLFTRYGDNHREPASSTTNFNFTGDLVVKDQRDAARMAAERRRLQQSSHGQIPAQAAS